MILGDILSRNAALFGDQPAIVFEDRVMTYRQLGERAHRLANALCTIGVQKQDRVVMLAQNCPEYLEVYGAAATAGFIAVGLNYRLSSAEQVQILSDCEPKAWIFEARYANRVEEVCAGLKTRPQLICIGSSPSSARCYDQMLATASTGSPPIRATEEDTIFLVYTSGTTGRPKGVMLGQAGQVEQAKLTSSVCAATPVDRMLVVMPLYHIGAMMYCLIYAWCGARVILHRSFDPAAVFASLADHRVTATLLAPVMIQALLDAPEALQGDHRSLHTIYYSSAPMPLPLLRRAINRFGPIFAQLYGMTENALGTFLYKHQHVLDGASNDVNRLASAGQPYLGCDIEVRHPDGRLCGAGEAGEVTIRSPAMMQGYWNNALATAEALRDGWYYSGDIGYLDSESFLFLVDRKKDVIISGGENIYSREVEEALLTHPAVTEVAVIGVPDATWGEAVMAFVVCRRGIKVEAAELIAHCRSRIASYKKPRYITFLDALPRTSSTNKIDKKKLRAAYHS